MKDSILRPGRYLKFVVIVTPLLVLIGFVAFRGLTAKQSTAKTKQQSDTQEDQRVFANQPSWTQDFSIAFDGPPNPAIWNVATPALPIYNNEQQLYTDRQQNVRIEHGNLILEARKETLNDRQFTSGRVDTRGHQSFLYGKIAVTMQFPKGAGTWPAAWMLSATEKYTKRLFPTDKDWADPRFYMNDGELDLAEYIGADPKHVESSFHTYDQSYSESTTIPGDTEGFHTYAMLWTPDHIRYTIDGRSYHELRKTSRDSRKWPFDQPMYLILNLAMGGKMGGDIDSSTQQSWSMLVKKVEYYPYIGAAVP